MTGRFLMLCAVLALTGCGGEYTEEGAVLFAAHCAVCHGGDARGGGGANVAGLGRTPADLTVLAAQNGGEFPVARVAWMLEAYSFGTQPRRRMADIPTLQSKQTRRLRTGSGRMAVAQPQAAIIDWLQTVQRR